MRVDENGETVKGTKVQLFVYDLSRGLASRFSQVFIGERLDGIWHTSIVAYSHEYFYGQGIHQAIPYSTHHGKPSKVINLGTSHVPEDLFLNWLFELQEKYRPQDYHLLEHNCNHFTSEVARFLTGGDIPDDIKYLPRQVLDSPGGAGIRRLVDSFFGGGQPPVMDAGIPISHLPQNPNSRSLTASSSSHRRTSIPTLLIKPFIPAVDISYLEELDADESIISAIEADDWCSVTGGIDELCATLLSSLDIHDFDSNLINLASSLIAKSSVEDDSWPDALRRVLSDLKSDAAHELPSTTRNVLSRLCASLFSNLQLVRQVLTEDRGEELIDNVVDLAVYAIDRLDGANSSMGVEDKAKTWELCVIVLWNVYAVLDELGKDRDFASRLKNTSQEHWFRAFWTTHPEPVSKDNWKASHPTHFLLSLMTHLRILRLDPSPDAVDMIKNDSELEWKKTMSANLEHVAKEYDKVDDWLTQSVSRGSKQMWVNFCQDLAREYRNI